MKAASPPSPNEHGRYARAEEAIGPSRNEYKTTLQTEGLSLPKNFRSALGYGGLLGYNRGMLMFVISG